jgi:DNA-binding HxlR family transcriptional regulator
VPAAPWNGYGRFCPLARALDAVGERWTLVIVQELQKRQMRYGELAARLPGIGTSVLADRLRKLETGGVVERMAGHVGEGVTYRLTDRGRALEPALSALREWGAELLFDPLADGGSEQHFDIRYVNGAERIPDGSFELTVDGKPSALEFADGRLTQRPGVAVGRELAIDTDMAFLRRWARGELDWDDGISSGEVRVSGPSGAWEHWLAASGYLLEYIADDEGSPSQPLGRAD